MRRSPLAFALALSLPAFSASKAPRADAGHAAVAKAGAAKEILGVWRLELVTGALKRRVDVARFALRTDAPAKAELQALAPNDFEKATIARIQAGGREATDAKLMLRELDASTITITESGLTMALGPEPVAATYRLGETTAITAEVFWRAGERPEAKLTFRLLDAE